MEDAEGVPAVVASGETKLAATVAVIVLGTAPDLADNALNECKPACHFDSRLSGLGFGYVPVLALAFRKRCSEACS